MLSLKYACSTENFFFSKKTSRAVPPLVDSVKTLNCWPFRERKNGVNQGGAGGGGGRGVIEARSRDPASQSKTKAPSLSMALIGERLRALWESSVAASTQFPNYGHRLYTIYIIISIMILNSMRGHFNAFLNRERWFDCARCK